MDHFVEQRSEDRLPFVAPVAVRHNSQSVLATGRDISTSGLFVEGTGSFPIATVCEVEVLTDEPKRSIASECQVVRLQEDRHGNTMGMGLTFIEPKEAR
jgi:hypothetical protein